MRGILRADIGHRMNRVTRWTCTGHQTITTRPWTCIGHRTILGTCIDLPTTRGTLWICINHPKAHELYWICTDRRTILVWPWTCIGGPMRTDMLRKCIRRWTVRDIRWMRTILRRTLRGRNSSYCIIRKGNGITCTNRFDPLFQMLMMLCMG